MADDPNEWESVASGEFHYEPLPRKWKVWLEFLGWRRVLSLGVQFDPDYGFGLLVFGLHLSIAKRIVPRSYTN